MNLDENILKDFPNEGKIYLNNASVSLMPFVGIQAMTNFLITYNSLGPDSLDSDPFIREKFQKTRKVIAKIVNCNPEEIIFTQSTTDGVNLVANGLKLESKSNIIIRGREHEHHANYYPWLRLGEKIKLKNLNIDENGFFDFQEFINLIDNNTKLVSLSHALYNTGAILPIKEVGEILEKKGIPYFLDTAQTIGCIGDFNVQDTKCNFMAFNGSKWLCGPMGTGIFYCKKNSKDLLEPIAIGGESAMIYDNVNLAFKEIPDKFQTGFRNYVGIAGLESSTNYLLNYGIGKIRKKIIKLANQLREDLSKISRVTLFGPDEESKRTSIVSFTLKGYEAQEIVEKLEKKNIVLAVREIFDKKIIRASPHFFNSESDIEKVVYEIKNL